MSHHPTLSPLPTRPIRPASTDAILDALPAAPEILDVLPLFEESIADALPAVRRGFFGSIWHFIASVSEWLFGAVALIVGLAILSAIPIVQFLTLGYLLEVGGRIGRTGKFREGFVGVRRAARVGSIGIGLGLLYLVLYVPSSLARSAQIIDVEGGVAQQWQFWVTVLTGVVMFHAVAALSRGGKLRYFFWPFNFIWLIRRVWRGGYYTESCDAVWNFVVSLRLPYYFWLGARGFAGTMIWLAIPIWLTSLGLRFPVIGIFGSLLFMFVLLYVPILQMRFARENRFRVFFEFRKTRQEFRRAPVAFAFALFIALLFALPLYLMKIEIIPPELVWLESLFFIILMFPSRLLAGWALARAARRTTPRHWFFRWTARLSMIPVVFIYVFLVFYTQHVAWNGVPSLFEQHAFLLPAPFWGWK
ncbi:MAG: hypothetical protein K2R98_19735 [Gemmataceae bacterium]|nr:hypothetical protein [Gemmataceae bacterium]